MTDKVQCSMHGECDRTYVCTHLTGESAGLGFNRDEPSANKPFPDAWCDDCELIRAAHGDWNEESEKLTKIALLCSGCYERAFIRNTRPTVTLDDLSDLRWKCDSCEEWHSGPCLDFAYDHPDYWTTENEAESKRFNLLPKWARRQPKTFLNEDYCAIEDRDFFVRGLINLPIIGTGKMFCWGVWGSLSRANFDGLRKAENDPHRDEMAPMFSWLSNQIEEYPDTLNLKMYAHIQEPGLRPNFRLEPTDHPLSIEYHKGIPPERVKEIMSRRLRYSD